MTGPEAQNDASACRVSIVVPTYSRGGLLRENIDSVLGQDFEDYEVVYVDDGSTDSTAEVLAEYAASHAARFHYTTTANGGPGRARNAGASIARGQFLLFTDDDTVVPPNWVAGMLEGHAESGQEVLCGGIAAHSMGTPVERYLHYRMQSSLGRKPRLLKAAPTGNLLIPRELFLAAGGFRDEALPAAEDWDLSHRLRKHGATIYYDPRVAVAHRYQAEWASAAKRLRATGAMGVYLARGQYRSVAAYVGYSVLRFLASPMWIPRHYPADLYVLAWRMEGVFALARMGAYLRSLFGRSPLFLSF